MKQSLRTCAATGTKLPQNQLLRFVAVKGVPTPEFYLHPTHRAPGRGVYIQPNAEALAQAVKKKSFAHKLKTNRPPPAWEEIAAKLAGTVIPEAGRGGIVLHDSGAHSAIRDKG